MTRKQKVELLENIKKYDLYEGAEFELIREFPEDGVCLVEDACGGEYEIDSNLLKEVK